MPIGYFVLETASEPELMVNWKPSHPNLYAETKHDAVAYSLQLYLGAIL